MIGKKLYVGNLYVRVNKTHLENLFSEFGEVKRINLIDGSGFAFVEMGTAAEAESARRSLDGKEFMERIISVKDANPPHPLTRKELNSILKTH